MNKDRKTMALAAALLLTFGLAPHAPAESPRTLRLDYATYNPVSLILKEKGWIEEEFAAEGIRIQWILSLGSNRALEFLNSNTVDFGSTAGAAALMARANLSPIQIVYLFQRPEWTALVTRADTGIARIEDLKGRRVAATMGTDPYIFLLRSLALAGLTARDVQIVSLQHGDGANALLQRQVDAWAGLDPHMARLQLEAGAILFYRNVDFVTFGTLLAREDFARRHPEIVTRVLRVYERGRAWARENPEDAVRILAAAAKIAPEVARLQLAERTDLTVAVPGDALREALVEAGQVLLEGGLIRAGTDIPATVDALINPVFAREVVQP